MSVAIDHVIWGTRDLEAAGRRFWDEHGLASYEGGVHPAFGTANRIIPLGDSYIELMGIADQDVARGNPLGQFVLDTTAGGDRWILWCLRTDDIDVAAARIGSVVVPGERRRPDGSTVSWRLAGLETALSLPPLPFFIDWEDRSAYPGAATLEHRCGADGIARLEVAAGGIQGVVLSARTNEIRL
ncbi:MAG: VOC family protein [Actinomycetota bacterium]